MVGNPPNANLMAELSVKWGKRCIGCLPTFSSCHSNPWFIPPVLKNRQPEAVLDSLFSCHRRKGLNSDFENRGQAVSYMPALSNLPYFAGLVRDAHYERWR